jgi:DNA-binding response OmpR family regulator
MASKSNDNRIRRKRSNFILVVDDEPDANMTLRTLLEENGFETDGYTDPVKALQSFIPGKFDLLLLDIKMPRIGGFELYQKLKEIDKDVKVCFVTASELFYEEYREDRHIDEKYFILKPMKNEEMMRRINNILNEYEYE